MALGLGLSGNGGIENIAAGGGLLAANNLSDVASATTSRTNLGLGTAAVQNVAAFAQTANNLSDLASATTARTNLGLGTSATHPATDFLLAANNLSDVTAATARTNLGLAAIAASGSASDLAAGTVPTARFPGGAFNGVSELVQLDGSGKMPAVDGTALTGVVLLAGSTMTGTLKLSGAATDAVRIEGGGNSFSIRHAIADTNPVLSIDNTGKMTLGAGGGTATDVNWYRQSAGSIGTDNALMVGVGSAVGGIHTFYPPSGSTDALIEVLTSAGTNFRITSSNNAATGVTLQTQNAAPLEIKANGNSGMKISTTGALGFYGATPVAQASGSSDVLASLVSLGLRAASSNPPLNLGTGAVTAGAGTFSGLVTANAGLTVVGAVTLPAASVGVAAITGLAAIATSGSASDLSAGTVPTARFPGGAFNGVSELVQLDGGGLLPALDGSALINLNASALSSGTIPNPRLAATVALLSGTSTFTGNKTFNLPLTIVGGFKTTVITSGALPTVTLTSGTGVQISTTRDVTMVISVTATLATGTCTIALSPDNVTYSTVVVATPGVLNGVDAVTVNVPVNWYVKATDSNTSHTATYY